MRGSEPAVGPGAGLDVAVVWGLLLGGAWIVPLLPGALPGKAEWWVVGIAMLWTVVAILRRRAFSEIGIRFSNLLSSVAVFSAPVVLVFGCYAVLRFLNGRPVERPQFTAGDLYSYFLWAFAQQLVAVVIFWSYLVGRGRTFSLSGPKWPPNWTTALGTATFFALAHAPNPGLMLLTWTAESMWLVAFVRFRNLFALAAAHAIAALLALAWWVPSPLLPNLRVGLRYWAP